MDIIREGHWMWACDSVNVRKCLPQKDDGKTDAWKCDVARLICEGGA